MSLARVEIEFRKQEIFLKRVTTSAPCKSYGPFDSIGAAFRKARDLAGWNDAPESPKIAQYERSPKTANAKPTEAETHAGGNEKV